MSEHEIVEQETENPEEDTTAPPEAETAEAEEQASEPEEKPQPQNQIEQDGVKYVRQEALAEERQRRREAERRAEQRLADIEERFTRLAQPSEPDIPDPNDNFIGTVQALRQRELERAQQQNETAEETRKREQEEAQWSTVQARSAAAEQTFSAQQPDYREAIDYLRQSRIREWEMLGYDSATAFQQVQQEERNLMWNAVANEQSPAEIAYNLAKHRGYKPKAASEGEDKVKRVAEGQKQARTLNGGGQPEPEKGLKWLMSLTDDEYKALSDDEWRRAMGG